jgi:tetratricopeptide (TPR) repeat protein
VLDGLASLVDKSLLIQREQADGEPRFYMLATVREFGLERLAEAGEEAAARRAHAEFYLDLAERAEPELIGPDQGRWLDRLEADLDNFRSVRTWVLGAGGWGLGAGAGAGSPTPNTQHPTPPEIGLRLAGALWRFLMARGYLTEGRGWLEEALATGPDAPAAVRAKATQHLGDTTLDLGDYVAARAHYEAASVLRRALGDELGTPLDLRRFRPNIHVALDVDAFAEEGWQGRRLRVGEAELELLHPCERCAIPTRHPDTHGKWPELLKHLAAEHSQLFGINARAHTAATVRVGDPVELLEA